MLGAFSHPDGSTALTADIIVIGIGNDFRRDDGVGLAVARRIAERNPPGVRVASEISEPTALLEAWAGAARAIVIDAAAGENSAPGKIRRWTESDLQASAVVSSHALGLAKTCALGRALARMPEKLVVFTVDVVDTHHGIGLTPPVTAAVPRLVDAIIDELSR
jgi:hydrogenase maturation protease